MSGFPAQSTVLNRQRDYEKSGILELENERLRAENDFLKKLDALTLKKNKQRPSKD